MNITVREKLCNDIKEVGNYIAAVDAAREECVRAGQFRGAQACVDRIREVCMRFVFVFQKEARAAHVAERRRLEKSYELEYQQAETTWKQRLRHYDKEAARRLAQLERQQLTDLKAEDAWSCRSLTAGTTLSPEMTELHAILESMVHSQRYEAASRVQREIATLRKREQRHRLHHVRCTRSEHLNKAAERLKAQRAEEEDSLRRGRCTLLEERDAQLRDRRERHERAMLSIDADAGRVQAAAIHYVNQELGVYLAPALQALDGL